MLSDSHPSSLFKYCPKCGSDKFQAINERAKKCKNCSFEYYFNTSAAVAALIFNEEGKLLFTRRAIEPYKGMLDLPGGFIEHMETAEEALRRELKEELGVEVIEAEYFRSFPNKYPFSGLLVFTLDLFYKVKVKSTDKMVAMDDISAFEFYYPTEIDIDELPSFSMRKIIQQLNSKR